MDGFGVGLIVYSECSTAIFHVGDERTDPILIK